MKTSKSKIVLLGTGLLGSSIAERLLLKDFDLTVWNRTLDKCRKLKDLGAKLIKSIDDINQDHEVIIFVMRDGEVTSKVISEISSLKNKLIIQMGTIGSSFSKKIENYVIQQGGFYLEAPVLGSVKESLNGELIIMVGGNSLKFKEYEILFKALSNKYHFLGDVVDASSTKLALNYLIASLTHSFSNILKFVEFKNIDIEKFMEILRDSSLYAPTFDKKLGRMKSGDYNNPNFNVNNLSKDISLFLEEVISANFEIDSIKEIDKLIKKSKKFGLQKKDYSIIHKLTSKI